MMASKAERSTTRSLITGNDVERHGSTVIVSPVLKFRMCSWQVVVIFFGPCGTPLMTTPHEPQIPSRQSWSNAIGSLPSSIRLFVDHVEHFEERHVLVDVVGHVGLEPPFVVRAVLPPDLEEEVEAHL